MSAIQAKPLRPAIVIPISNGEPFLKECLDALLPQCDDSVAVIAVNNGSADQSAALLAAYPRIILLDHAAPLGFAGAVNCGIRAALTAPQRPDVIVVLNQDTRVDPGWLAALLAPFADAGLGVVGSVARFPNGAIQHAGAQLDPPRWYGRNLEFMPTPVQATFRPAENAEQGARPFVSFVAVALRVAMLEQVGLLDEAFWPAYFEDVDLCLRAVAAGWRLTIASGATLTHHEGAQSSSVAHSVRVERNRLRLLLKHAAPAQLVDEAFAAERAALLRRAADGTSQVLRQAYLHALLAWPVIAAQRHVTAAEYEAVAGILAELRDLATTRERRSRVYGLETHARERRTHGPALAPQAAHALRAVPVPSARSPVMPIVSIIMLTWNGLEYTQQCIASIHRHTAPDDMRLIVVDNGSTDGTREWLAEQADITLIANATNLGFTRGNNQGMHAALADSDMLLLNNDTEILHDGWLARLRAVAHSAPDIGIVGCTLLHSNGRLQHAGTYMPTNTFWGYQIGGGEEYIGQYPGVRDVQGITGACMYIRRDLYATIGGLDPAYFSYFEDSDYCLRARVAGYRSVCTGDVQIAHHENTSTKINRSDWRAMFSAAQQTFQATWQDALQKRYTRGLLWHSLVALPTGYATSSREIIRELDRRDVDVRLACIFGTDYTEPPTNDPRIDQLQSRPKDLSLPQVVYSQADAFVKNSGAYKIGFTMLEADGLPLDWVNQANQMDEVWTPTEWGAEVFRASGITRPLHVVPLGFNPDYFHPGITARRMSSRYTFLSVFDWIERKAPDLLIRAFLRAFSARDDVLLVLKVSNSDPRFDVRRHLADLTGNGAWPPIVVLLNQAVDAHQMSVLYRSADCFVLPTRGEGWGMPAVEAMACGLPVITTDWGAQTAFLRPEISYPLRVRGLVPAVARAPYYAGLRWAEPDEDHLCDLMRYVYANPDEARQRGARAAADVHARWTWRNSADTILARLDAL